MPSQPAFQADDFPFHADPMTTVYVLSYDRTVQIAAERSDEQHKLTWGHTYSNRPFDVPFVESDLRTFVEANRAARKAEADAINARAAERARAACAPVLARAA